MTKPCSVIIPTLNEEKYLPVLLRSLNAIEAPLQIIVVDGQSKDTTVQVAESFTTELSTQHSLQVITTDRGISHQRNRGTEAAAHDILLFCDADLVAPSSQAHIDMITAFDQEGYGIATAQIVPLENLLGALILHKIAYCMQRLLAFWYKRAYFAGAYQIVNRSVFEQYGGYNTDLRVSEDVDLSYRISEEHSFKIFPNKIKVSTRRFQKYGYSWIFANLKDVLQLTKQGKMTNNSDYYQFGDF